jgi:uncharacterized protein YbjT (DUF2867 family)
MLRSYSEDRQSAEVSGVWGVLVLVFIPWTILAPPAGLVVALVAWRFWVPARAEVYGDLVVSAFDMHRTASTSSSAGRCQSVRSWSQPRAS